MEIIDEKINFIKRGKNGKYEISDKIKNTIRKAIHYIYIDKKYRVSHGTDEWEEGIDEYNYEEQTYKEIITGLENYGKVSIKVMKKKERKYIVMYLKISNLGILWYNLSITRWGNKIRSGDIIKSVCISEILLYYYLNYTKYYFDNYRQSILDNLKRDFNAEYRDYYIYRQKVRTYNATKDLS